MFQRMNVPIQIDEVRYTQIQSLLQKEKPNTNDIKKLFDDLINDNFKRTNNVRRWYGKETKKEFTDVQSGSITEREPPENMKRVWRNSYKNKSWIQKRKIINFLWVDYKERDELDWRTGKIERYYTINNSFVPLIEYNF